MKNREYENTQSGMSKQIGQWFLCFLVYLIMLLGVLNRSPGFTDESDNFIGGMVVASGGRMYRDFVTVRFKNSVTAIDHADLDIPNGIFGLLGENGAGKTTLMRVLTTVLKPTNGMVTLDGILYSEGNYEKIQRKIGYLPQEIELYPNLTVQECLEYMGDLAGVPKAECRKRIDYYLKKTSLIEHRKKKMKQLSGGMKRRVGLVQALLNEPEFLIVDEPTTGLDPEERIRIRNLLVDFSENRTVLFSTHVVEDLAATCNQLAIMHKGRFLYAGSMKNLTEEAQGKIWICKVPDERKAREVEQKYRITSKQYVEGGLQLRVISEIQPELECMSIPATLEDAYIYVTNQYE